MLMPPTSFLPGWPLKTYWNNVFKNIVCAVLVISVLTACGGGGSVPASSGMNAATGGGAAPAPSATLGGNVLAIRVDKGPAGNNVNRLYTDVTICQSGSTSLCQTIDHVLVDTGSTGLRLLSGVVSPSLNLSSVSAASGLPLLACARFLDNTFAWGPVVAADITLGGRTAAGLPVQMVADPAFNGLARLCSAGATIDSVASLGANGIIGLGLFKEDCGASCASVTANGVYFTCTTAACTAATATRATAAKQLKNPIPLFASDNNGFLIDLPAVASAGAVSLNGSLIFGIGTQSNNQVTSSRVLTTSSTGYFQTLFAGQSLNTSFIDTGSNSHYFDSPEIPTCSGGVSASFYCPTSLLTLSATQVGTNGAIHPVEFFVDNATTLFADSVNTVLPNLAGTIGSSRTFVWGLPFFYGRRVFTVIEGQPSVLGTGALYAF
jgi:hypothetical protein